LDFPHLSGWIFWEGRPGQGGVCEGAAVRVWSDINGRRDRQCDMLSSEVDKGMLWKRKMVPLGYEGNVG
jgi:hypothetical protein